MRVTLISPRIPIQKGDFLGSGVPYWPIELATLASFARDHGDEVSLIDLFGNNPQRIEEAGDHYLQGESIDEYLDSPQLRKAEIIILYAISYMSHGELLKIVKILAAKFSNTPIAVLENSQAVTAYSLQRMIEPFLGAGCRALICGEPWFNWEAIKSAIIFSENSAPNVIKSINDQFPKRQWQANFNYPIPAWDLINLAGYWKLPYSHGPKTPTFLPMLTSRGCPYPCNFCVIPETNDKRWRGNSPDDVVKEIIFLRDRFNVKDFQIEDLNPTVRHERWERICELLIEHKAEINFYFVSGTKAETLRLDKIPLFARAGCRYISISPESGSKNLMKIIGKKFNYQHGLDLVRSCHKNGIRTQACFLVGHPDEHANDFLESKKYMSEMVRAGLDEVAVFVVAPFAGSQLFELKVIDIQSDIALASFSPKGRTNYLELEAQRKLLIKIFFLEKLKQGSALWMQGLRSIFGTPQTKMENLPKRILFIFKKITLVAIKKRLGYE